MIRTICPGRETFPQISRRPRETQTTTYTRSLSSFKYLLPSVFDSANVFLFLLGRALITRTCYSLQHSSILYSHTRQLFCSRYAVDTLRYDQYFVDRPTKYVQGILVYQSDIRCKLIYIDYIMLSTSWSSCDYQAVLAGVFPCQSFDFLFELLCRASPEYIETNAWGGKKYSWGWARCARYHKWP